MGSSRRGNFVQERCRYFVFTQRRRELVLVKKEGKYIRSWKNTCDRVDDTFAAGKRNKPMMNYRYSHTPQV
jgi:hypothetical protein